MDARGRRDSRYRIGYARVSTLDQNLALQQDALKEAGCEKIFIEQLSGAGTDRPALREVLEYARSGDTLVVWKLDRLARSMKQLIETIEKLRLSSSSMANNAGSSRVNSLQSARLR
jgi:DNA invertase Pin-like site-specific DNA recombinase